MMILQDEMLRATRRFEASGLPTMQALRHEMDHAALRDEAGEIASDTVQRIAVAPPATVRQPLALLRLWLVRRAAT